MENARRQLELLQAEQQAEKDELRKLEAALSDSLVQERQVSKKVQRQRELKRLHEKRTEAVEEKIRRLRKELVEHEQIAKQLLQKEKHKSYAGDTFMQSSSGFQEEPATQQQQQQQQQEQDGSEHAPERDTLDTALLGQSMMEDSSSSMDGGGLGPLQMTGKSATMSTSTQLPPPGKQLSCEDSSLMMSMSAPSFSRSQPQLLDSSQQSTPTLKEWFREKDGGVKTRDVSQPAVMKMVMDEDQQREAIRRALVQAAGSVKGAFRSLDLSGSGTVSQSEFERGMERLGVDYVSLTGIRKIGKVFKLFDAHKTGALDMSGMFGKDTSDEQQRLSTPDFWQMWVRRNKDFSKMDNRSGPRWSPATADDELQLLFEQANTRKEIYDKKNWMRATMRRLKSRGKSDARCRELVALHLPRGTGPKDREDVQTFSENDVRLCKRSYTDAWQEPTRNIQKQLYDLRDKRRDMMISRQRLEVMIAPPQRKAEEQMLQKAATVKALDLGIGKPKDAEAAEALAAQQQAIQKEAEKVAANQKAMFKAMLAKHGFELDQVETLYRIYMKHSDPVTDTLSRHGFETLLHALCQNRTLVESDLDAWWAQVSVCAAKYDPPGADASPGPRSRATFEHFMEWWATSEVRARSGAQAS